VSDYSYIAFMFIVNIILLYTFIKLLKKTLNLGQPPSILSDEPASSETHIHTWGKTLMQTGSSNDQTLFCEVCGLIIGTDNDKKYFTKSVLVELEAQAKLIKEYAEFESNAIKEYLSKTSVMNDFMKEVELTLLIATVTQMKLRMILKKMDLSGIYRSEPKA
jgi:hypothetical protein